MYKPFEVAQASTSGQAQPSPPRVITLAKPQGDQAVSVRLDGATVLNLANIANENITLVRVGDKLVILFDNKSTITIEPVFDASGQFQDIAFQLGADRVVTGTEFAGLFPITTDQSILPAAGNAGPASGANFSEHGAIDALGGSNPLALLSNLDGGGDGGLGGGNPGTNTAPIIGAIQIGNTDDEGLPEGNLGGPGDAPGADVSITISLNIDWGQDVTGRTLAFSGSQPGLTGLTSAGQPINIVLTTLGGLPALIGYTGADPNDPAHQVFTITLNAGPINGEYTFTLKQPLDHPIIGTEDTIALFVNFIATDGNGDVANGTFQVNVNDDSPEIGTPGTSTLSEDDLDVSTPATTLAIDWGADNNATLRSVGFTDTSTAGNNVTVTDQNGDPLTLYSNGQLVSFVILSGVLVGYVGSTPLAIGDPNVVLTVSLSSIGDGSYTLDLRQPLDHPPPVVDEHFLDLTISYTATDADGDPVASEFTVRVDAAGTINAAGDTISYAALNTGVFINLDDSPRTIFGQTVAENTATDEQTVPDSDRIVGIDQLGSDIVNATGGAGDDVIIGGDEANILNGRGGADLIYGRAGDDQIAGGAGQDEIYGGRGNDTISGGSGADFIAGGRGNDIIDGNDGADHIHGNQGDDTIRGGDGDDLLEGNGGDDTIRGGDGSDALFGGFGNDRLRGGNGADLVVGDDGNDFLFGEDGQDALYGGDGEDTIDGGDGADLIFGGADDDQITGGAGQDEIYGGLGDDTIDGGSNADFVAGGRGDDVIDGGDGADHIHGGLGDDAIQGGDGADELFGGRGDDTIDGGDGQDFIAGGRGDDIIDGGAGADHIHGNRGDDTIRGGGAGDLLEGGAGNDEIWGGAGVDTLVGGGNPNSSADHLLGNAGDDTLYGNETDLSVAANKFAQVGENDVAAYSGDAPDYSVTWNSGLEAWQVTRVTGGGEGAGSVDTLYGIEGIDFGNDGSVDLDLTAAVFVFNDGSLVGTFDTITEAVDLANTLAPAGSGLLIEAGHNGTTSFAEGAISITQAMTIQGVGPSRIDVGATGATLFTIDAGVTGGVTFQNLALQNSGGADYGIRFNGAHDAGAGTGGTLTIDNVSIAGFDQDGVFVNGGGTSRSVTITGSEFTGNGGNATSGGSGDVLFFEFTGDATLTDVVVTGTTGTGAGSADHGIQFAGFLDSTDAVTNAIGSVAFTNVTAQGTYEKTLVFVQGYSDFSNLDLSGGLFLGDSGTPAQTGWTTLFITGAPIGGAYADPDAGNPSVVDLSGVQVLGWTYVGALSGFFAQIAAAGAQLHVTGTIYADDITGSDANDSVLASLGDDTISTGDGDDLLIYLTGDGADTVDGGDGTDTQVVVGTSAPETFNITAVGSTIDIDIDSAQALTLTGIDEIVVQTGPGGDTVNILGSFGATDLDISTITVEGGAGADEVNASGITSEHRVVFTGVGGNDTFISGAGNDTFDGGDDFDSAVYADVLGNYSLGVTTDGNGFVTGFTSVQDGNAASVGDEGTDQLSNVEQLVFENADGPGGSTTVLDLTKSVQLFNASNQLIGTFDDLKSAADAANATAGTNFTIRLAADDIDVGGSQVVIDKDITIVGAGMGATTLHADFDTAGDTTVDATGMILVNTGMTANFSDLKIDGAGEQIGQAIRHLGQGTVERVHFANIKHSTYVGIGISIRENADVDVLDSTFTNIERIGAHYRGAGVTGRFEGNTYTGKGIVDGLDYAAEAGGGAVIQVLNNIVSNNLGVASDGSTSAAFLVTTYFGLGTDATFGGNLVTDSTAGVAAGFPGPSPFTLVEDRSDITFLAGNNFADADTGVVVVGDVTATDTQLVNGTFDWEGGPGNNFPSGADLADDLRGGDGDDTLTGFGGADQLEGGAGNDEIWGGDAGDTLVGGGQGDSTADLLLGNAGDDNLYGNETNLAVTANKFAQVGENDVAAYSGNAADYQVNWNAGLEAWQVTRITAGGEGIGSVDTLYGVEGIDFGNNGSVDFNLAAPVLLFRDTDSNPGNGKELVGTFATLTAAVTAAAANDTIELTSNYNVTETVTVGAGLTGLEILGANEGIAHDGARGAESVLTGGILVQADNVKIDGLRIVGGGAFLGDTAGVFVLADNVDVSNTVFFRATGGVGDGSRGIVTAIGQGANVDVTGSSFEGWATGIYFNPGAANATVVGNAFTSNFVGISNDDPDDFQVTSNTFTNQNFENIGIGVADTSEDLSTQITAANTFIGSVPEVSIYPYAGSPQDITGTQYEDTFNASANGDTLSGLGGDDVLNGGGGFDTLKGGLGADTIDGGETGELYTPATGEGDRALYDATLDASDITTTFAGWQVATGGAEGTDEVINVEIVVDGGGQRFLLVGSGGFDTIQAAINEAVAGDTILIAPGTWSGPGNVNLTIDKVLTIIGSGDGSDPGDTVIDGGGFVVNLAADAAAGTVSFQNLAIVNAGNTGINAQDQQILGTLSLDQVRIEGAASNGLIASGRKASTAYDQAGVQNVVIANSSFIDNAQSATNSANIVLFEFDGDATITNVNASNSVTGANSAAYGVQIAGFDGPLYNQKTPAPGSSIGSYDVLTPLGIVTIDGLHVSGETRKASFYIQGYTDTSGLAIANSTVDTHSGWNKPVIIDPMADQLPSGIANDSGNAGSFFDASAADGFYDLSGLTVTQYAGQFSELDGTTEADVITGTNATDLITGFGGNDTLSGGAGDDTILYTVGDGTDTIDGGEGDETVGDTLVVTATGDADYIRISPNLDGDAHLDIDIDANSLVEVPADGIELDVTNVEEIVVNTGAGDDTVVISGDLSGAGVAQNTITVNGGDGNDTIDVSGMSSSYPVHVVFDGGIGDDTFKGGVGNDTFHGGAGFDSAVYGATYASSLVTWDGTTATVANGASGTDTIDGVGKLEFAGGTTVWLVGATGEYTTLTQLFDGNAANGEVNANDVVFLAPGTYSANINIALQGIEIRGAGDGTNPSTDTILNFASGNAINFSAGSGEFTLRDLRIAGAGTGTGLHLQTDFSGLMVDNVTFHDMNIGIRKPSFATLADVAITNTDFTDNNYGIYFANDDNNHGVTAAGVSLTGVNFTNNLHAAMYAETLQNATFTGIVATGNATGSANGIVFDFWTGYDGTSFSTIAFDDVSIDNSAGSAVYSAGIRVVAFDDAAGAPTGISFNDVSIDNALRGIRTNADETQLSFSGTNTLTDVTNPLRYEGRDGADDFDAAALPSLGSGDYILLGDFYNHFLGGGWAFGGNDMLAGAGGNDQIFGNLGDDTLIGRGGNDAIDGGAGNDTATFAGDFATYSFTLGASVTVTDNAPGTDGNDGADTVANVERYQFDDTTVLIVDGSGGTSGGYASIGAALAAAAAVTGHVTVLVAAGTYNENVTISRDDVTLLGMGDGDDVIIHGAFKSAHGLAETDSVADFLKTHGYSTSSGSGVNVTAGDVTISNLKITSFFQGITLGDGVERVRIEDVTIDGTVDGIYKAGTDSVDDLDLVGGLITDSYIGLHLVKLAGGGDASNVTVDGTNFIDLLQKGIYAETLQGTTLFDNIIMTNVGQYGGGSVFGAAGKNGAGIDVNLKFGTYSGPLTIEDFTFTNVGLSNGLGTSHFNGAAIAIKARDDGGYASPAASFTGLLLIQDGTIAGTSTGIRAGEPGKNIAGPAVTIENVEISGALHSDVHGDVDNVTQSLMTIVMTDASEMLVAAPTSTGMFDISGLGGADEIHGGRGDDTLRGGDGDDVFYATAGDTIVEGGGVGSGTDEVRTADSFTLAANVENLMLLDGATQTDDFENFDIGPITNGENGWRIVAGRDQGVVDDGGNKVFRMSSDPSPDDFAGPYSTSLPFTAGEPSTTADYSAQSVKFRFKAVDPSGDNSRLEVDFGNEAGTDRNNFMVIEATAAGVRIAVNEPLLDGNWTTNDFAAFTGNVMLTSGASLSDWHDIELRLTYVDGQNNDVIQVYFDSQLIGTTTTFENYRDALGGFHADNAEANQTSRVFFRPKAGGAATDGPGGVNEGFLFDDLTTSVYYDASGTGNGLDNVITGNSGDNTIAGLDGSDTLTGGAGADRFRYTATTEGGDHITDFSIAEGDIFEILASSFGVTPGTEASVFSASTDDNFGSATERFHYNTTSGALTYDSNGSDAGGTLVTLATLDNHAAVAAAQIHFAS